MPASRLWSSRVSFPSLQLQRAFSAPYLYTSTSLHLRLFGAPYLLVAIPTSSLQTAIPPCLHADRVPPALDLVVCTHAAHLPSSIAPRIRACGIPPTLRSFVPARRNTDIQPPDFYICLQAGSVPPPLDLVVCTY